MDYRMEKDSMGEVKVPANRLWGAQTERSRNHFEIGKGHENMPEEIIHAFGILKKAAALANFSLVPEKMTKEKCDAICRAADELLAGHLTEEFPLVVFQTGSGTQSNMNVNEVLANLGNKLSGASLLHPNDDVNRSQSSNDTFPTALHLAAVVQLNTSLLPALERLMAAFEKLEQENLGIVKSGRTHLQDATPIAFSQEISGWRTSLLRDRDLILSSIPQLSELALGGTAVGDSVAYILEEMGLERCGCHGTTAALAMLNDAVKKGGVMASSHVGGLSGSFIPVSEDAGMIAAAEEGVLTLEKLEAMTAVCSVGLDMIAIPGDTPEEVIDGIIADEISIGVANTKTTAVRVIPACGKKAGDKVEFGGLLGHAPVMSVKTESPAKLIRRGGRIPAPIHSLKNKKSFPSNSGCNRLVAPAVLIILPCDKFSGSVHTTDQCRINQPSHGNYSQLFPFPMLV